MSALFGGNKSSGPSAAEIAAQKAAQEEEARLEALKKRQAGFRSQFVLSEDQKGNLAAGAQITRKALFGQ